MADADFVQASRYGEAQRRIIRVAAEHPCKWKNRVVVRIGLALESAYRLHAHHIRECTAQPRRLLRVVVYDHELVLCRLARKAAVKFGHELCLALDVVELYALYPELLAIFEEPAPVRRKPHLVHGGLPEPYPDGALLASSTSSLTFLNAPRSVFAQSRQPLSARLYSYPASCARALNSIIFSKRRLCSSSIKYDHALLPGRIQSAFSYILSLMGAAAWAITRQ